MLPTSDIADAPARVLIVDNERPQRRLLEAMLAPEGFLLETAASGEEALAMVAQHAPDLILLDIMMPGMTGHEVVARIKSNPATKHVPVIMVTALDDRDSRLLGLNAGAEDFLTKPVDRAELRARVRNLLRLKAYGDHYDTYSQSLEDEVRSRTADLVEHTKTLDQQSIVLADQAGALEERTRELSAALERAERVSRIRDTLLMTVSHELRTPLNAILGWADILERNVDPALVQRGLPVIKRNAVAQVRVIDDLLDVATIATGQMRLDMRPTDLQSVVTNAIEVVQPAARARNISIVSTGVDAATVVLGDPVRLHQVIWNLLSNAVKFTPEGGTVYVVAHVARERVRLEVSDSGVGIESRFLSSVFEQFFQADGSPTRKYNGLGLGLAIVRELVEMQGGTVEALSAGPNQGATFTVELPVYHGSARPVGAGLGAAMDQLTPEASDLTGVRVLIVDDDPDSRTTAAMILEEAGASTLLAESASTGLHSLQEHDVDVVVSDIAMPHVDGLAFIQGVRTLPDDVKRRVPAIALTALTRDEDREWILAAGFQKYAAKPVSAEHLVQCVAGAAHLGRTAG